MGHSDRGEDGQSHLVAVEDASNVTERARNHEVGLDQEEEGIERDRSDRQHDHCREQQTSVEEASECQLAMQIDKLGQLTLYP